MLGGAPEAEAPERSMDKRKRRYLITALAGLVLFLAAWNFPPLSFIPRLAGLEPMIHVYPYQSADGSYRNDVVPEKGRDIEMVQDQFDAYKARHGLPDLVLYRKTKRDPWRFWMWYDYLTSPRWDHPYLDQAARTGS